jgi:hypothetical protein
VQVLVAEAREQEGDRLPVVLLAARFDGCGRGLLQKRDGLIAAAADERAPVGEGLPAALQGEGDVGESCAIELGVGAQVSREVGGRGREGAGALRREQEELVGARRGLRRRQRGRLLEDDVGVRAAEPESAHPRPARPTRPAIARPRRVRASTSIGSPTGVPVPCASTYEMSAASTPLRANASAMTFAWPSTDGAV